MTYHVMPIYDIKEHKESMLCECNPKAEPFLIIHILVLHNSFDGNGLYEELIEEIKRNNLNLN